MPAQIQSAEATGRTVKVTWTNTGNTRDTLWAGLSLRNDQDEVFDIPPQEAAVNPGQQVTTTFTIPSDVPPAVYDLRASIWNMKPVPENEPVLDRLADTGWVTDAVKVEQPVFTPLRVAAAGGVLALATAVAIRSADR